MSWFKYFFAVCLVLNLSGYAFSADVILNEYNAVAGSLFLNGGNSSADADGGRASDSYFGRVAGNGGDWFELVVITDHLDMRSWKLDIYDNGSLSETLDLTNHSIWADLRAGTIITVSEDVPSDISYNPAAGDWWINVQANNDANGVYIEATNFVVSNNNWQLRIRNASGAVVFGPAGEGISPASGISDTEIFRLKADPSASITPSSSDYGDGKNFSTFGSSNKWGIQDVNQLRKVAPTASTVTLLSPNASTVIIAGTVYPIEWNTTGPVDKVLIEYSKNNGSTWLEVSPSSVANTGSFNWLVPMFDSGNCLVRVANANNPAVYDMSDGVFFVYQCPLDGDLTGDCIVTLADFAIMAANWLECADPYNPGCI
ncbi:MAG: hypothetical protein ABSH16_03675 [Sedimentisphaerales bacterium]